LATGRNAGDVELYYVKTVHTWLDILKDVLPVVNIIHNASTVNTLIIHAHTIIGDI
jgi:hypothetical protein